MTNPAISRLLDTLKLLRKIEKGRGFSYTLGFHLDNILRESASLSFEDQTLRVKIPVDKRLHLSGRDSLSLSTYVALIDDATTFALMCSDLSRSRAGVSIHLRGEWADLAAYPIHEIELVTTAHKVGKNVGFVSASVWAEGRPLVHGVHVKYLELPNMMTKLLMNPLGWNGLSWYANRSTPLPEIEAPPLAELVAPLLFVNDDTATLDVVPGLSSQGATMHGGSQAVFMEIVATRAAEQRLGRPVLLESMAVDYLASTSKKADFKVETIHSSETLLCLRVKLSSKGRLCSLGTLRFVPKAAGDASPVSQSKL